MRSTGWSGPLRKTGCANPRCWLAPGEASPTIRRSPWPASSNSGRWPPTCRSCRSCRGWALDDYLRCIDLYDRAGVNLAAEPVVGVGSVCRRQSAAQIEDLCAALAARGLRLHGFGVKALGLGRYARHLASADSMAWSYNARRHPSLAGHGHQSCANCITWALRWYGRAQRRAETQQLRLWEAPW